LAAGLAIGIVGDAGVRANAQEDRIFVGMILILIFAEALGLYGLIVALILSQWGMRKLTKIVKGHFELVIWINWFDSIMWNWIVKSLFVCFLCPVVINKERHILINW